MTYTPQLIDSTDEVRNMFTPSLSTDDISENELLSKIELVEEYIKVVYFDGSMPTQAKGRVPALLMVMSKIVKSANLYHKYGTPESIEIENYSVNFPTSETIDSETVKSWEQMAHQMLKEYDNSSFQVRKVND